MSIFRSTNPTDWNAVDGIIIAESAPAPNISGVAANIALLVGQFERGDTALTEVGSIGELFELYGKNDAFSGNIALKNKRFGRLKIARVVAATGAAKATLACVSSATTRITFTAKWKGAYGNSIQVTVAAGSVQGSKYTIHDASAGAVLPDEVYDNVLISAVGTTFANSRLVDVAVNSTAAEPSVAAATNLATGSDGAVADTDYQTAIGLTEVEASGNILFLDAYNSTRNGYLKTSMANTQDKMAVVCGPSGNTRAQAITDVANNRDVDGRIIYAFPWLYTNINGVNTLVNPASFYASLLSQTAPNIDPAYAQNAQFLSGIVGLEIPSLSRNDYIALMAAGISAFENDSDIGIKIKSGVVTQISDSSKIMVFRRRMADYLTASIAKFLKNYQNAPNSLENRTAVKGAILAFIQRSEQEGLLPKDSDVKSGLAKVVDTESLNTNSTIAQGYFKILYKQRIYSSMRFIVLQAQIGESVVVTEADSK
jgi:phage tail sheath protein FI